VSEQDAADKTDELTRRQWLLILGELAAVAGFSGVVPELAAALPGAEGQQSAGLPPGLYYPSHEHLSHALSDTGKMHVIPLGCETDYVRASSGAFHPQFFSNDDFQIVTRMVEILLGKVDAAALSQVVQWLDLYLYSAAGSREAALALDPLHRSLAIAYYGESAVRELETADPQNIIRSGLAALHQLSEQQYGRRFPDLDQSQQASLVGTLSNAKADTPLRRFFEILRSQAVQGYYTSPEGLRELDYKGNWYYGQCPGCEPTNR
jgi:gluconate 2-dehydrogenase subunit 3-like protein